MYALDPELGKKAARAINENLAAIVQKHPDRFVALADVPLQAPDAAAEELDYCVRRLGFRGVEIGTNVAGKEISRGRDAFWAKVQELTSSTSSGTRSTPPSPSPTGRRSSGSTPRGS